MKKNNLVLTLIFLIIIVLAFIFFTKSKETTAKITTEVKRGNFEILVYSSGQLEAENSEDILMPNELKDRSLRIFEIKITDLVEEGTVVDSGGYVATLDQKAIEEILNKANEELEQKYNELEDAKMDSNLNLSNYRDQIINAEEQVEEQRIVLKESKFESPAIIRKAEMNVDKALRKLEQEKNGYNLKKQQAESKVNRKKIELKQTQNRVKKLDAAYKSLIVLAPKKGMVIYKEGLRGDKVKVGSSVSSWNPTIAKLPDLSSMLSITYVNEIDISNVKIGQKVDIGIDAIPEKELKGEVVKVANIGQLISKSDAKVFEVKIRVFGDVSDLKPAMTTSNFIHAANFKDTLFIPSEAIFENDSMQYVYIDQNKVVKQVVDIGSQNENYSLIVKGVKEGDKLLLSEPENADELKIEGMDIYQKIKERKIKAEEEEQKRIAQQKKRKYIDNKKRKGSSNRIVIF